MSGARGCEQRERERENPGVLVNPFGCSVWRSVPRKLSELEVQSASQEITVPKSRTGLREKMMNPRDSG